MPKTVFVIIAIFVVLLPYTSNNTMNLLWLTIIKRKVLHALVHNIGMVAAAAVNLSERLDIIMYKKPVTGVARLAMEEPVLIALAASLLTFITKANVNVS